MKKVSLLCCALVLAISASFAQNPQSPQTARKAAQNYVIGFYNLENLFDTYDDPAKNDEQFLPEGSNKWTEEKYNKKLGNMAHVIAEMAKANGRYHTILGISEIENRFVIEELVSQPEIAGANFQIVHYDGPDRRGVDVALLYKPEQFKLRSSRSIPFDFGADSKINFSLSKAEQDYFRTRDILEVIGTIDGELFAFYVTHTPSRVGGKGGDLRSRCGEILYRESMKLMQEYPGIKIVTMGDMNDDPTDESMAVYHHGKGSIGEVSPMDFFNPYVDMLKAGFGSLCYQSVWCIYDQQLVNYNLAHAPEGTLQIQKVGNGYYGYIFKRPFMTTPKGQYKGYPYRTFSGGAFIGGYSDHYPTFIVIGK